MRIYIYFLFFWCPCSGFDPQAVAREINAYYLLFCRHSWITLFGSRGKFLMNPLHLRKRAIYSLGRKFDLAKSDWKRCNQQLSDRVNLKVIPSPAHILDVVDFVTPHFTAIYQISKRLDQTPKLDMRFALILKEGWKLMKEWIHSFLPEFFLDQMKETAN